MGWNREPGLRLPNRDQRRNPPICYPCLRAGRAFGMDTSMLGDWHLVRCPRCGNTYRYRWGVPGDMTTFELISVSNPQ